MTYIGQFMGNLVPTSENDKFLVMVREWQAIFLDVLADNDASKSNAFIAEHYDSTVERAQHEAEREHGLAA
jgi:hypothetical protein